MTLGWLPNTSSPVVSLGTVCHFRVTSRYLIVARASIAQSMPGAEGFNCAQLKKVYLYSDCLHFLREEQDRGDTLDKVLGLGSQQNERAPVVQVYPFAL